MQHRPARALALSAALLLIALTGVRAGAQQQRRADAPAQGPSPEISFTVSMPRPDTHLLQVEMRLRAAADASLPPQLDLLMPVWTPGSYLVREFSRHVQDFAARGAGGRELAWRKTNKNTWRVGTAGASEATVSYAVYANELSVRTNELNDRRAFWNNAALLMYPEGHLGAPSTVRVRPFGNWKVATGLPAIAGQTDTFRAEDFDALYDSPFLVADFRVLTFDVRNVPHRVVIEGEGNYDPERVRRDVRKIVETAAAMMGDLPYRDYTFLVVLHAAGGGGLEHRNSTALVVRRFGFRPESSYQSFLSLVAHEHFHAWNVKSIRPDALGPFDYTAENYTRLLWVAEGVTSYYGNLLVRRAGLTSDRDYLRSLATTIRTIQDTPGRLEQSIEEASFDAWIEQYRPDENAINTTVSYYGKGALVALLLDLEIRRRTVGGRSLDDVLRRLYDEFAKRNRNYTPEDFQRAAEQTAGSSLEEFFRRYVRGREELDYNAALSAVGLQLLTTAGDSAQQQRAHLGANLRQDGDRLTVTNVPAGTPAYDQGLYAADQIVAVDGSRASLTFLDARLEEKRPGDELRLTVFRADELRTLTIRLGGRPEENYRIAPVRNPTPEQARQYEAWLGAPFPKT
jgi:predicted metalloprotease with PDZ domain